jgi:hypothetical protein
MMKADITRCVNGLPEEVSEHCWRPLRFCAENTTCCGVVRLTGVGTVISRRGAEAQSFLQ